MIMKSQEITINTNGERFYNITDKIQDLIKIESGICVIFCPHTSCGLVINESFDPSAKEDMENFLKYLAPRNLKFITHTAEGPDDSPSHMKSILLQNTLNIPIENNQLLLGTWQGIYLCEFRDAPKKRKIIIKTIAD